MLAASLSVMKKPRCWHKFIISWRVISPLLFVSQIWNAVDRLKNGLASIRYRNSSANISTRKCVFQSSFKSKSVNGINSCYGPAGPYKSDLCIGCREFITCEKLMSSGTKISANSGKRSRPSWSLS